MRAHWIEGGTAISHATLSAQGVLYQALLTDEACYQPPLDRLKDEQGYVRQDVVELDPETPDLDAICAKYDKEHHHEEDEVRFVLDGAGIFDIRGDNDLWMRIEVGVGDLIIVPAGRHHRFELTEAKAIRCIRLFKDEAGGVPHYR